MSLIIDAIKKAQQLRLKDLKGTPFFKGPEPKGERRRIGRKYSLVLAASGLGVLLFLFLLGSYLFPIFRSQHGQKVASIEKKDPSVYESSKNEYHESRKEEVPPLRMDKSLLQEKPSAEEITEEPLKKSKVKKKKKKNREASIETEEVRSHPPLPMKEEDLSQWTGSEPTPVPDQTIKKAPPVSPKQEVLAKPMSAELESGKNRTIALEILAHFNSGVDFYQQREFSKAVQAYQKVIELDPNYAEAYNNLGIIYQEIGNFNKALGAYQKAIEINPRYEKALNNLGILLYLKDQWEESIEAFQKALALNPDNLESLINLGIVFKRRGKMDRAIECYDRALMINPFSGAAHYNLGLLFEQLGNFELAIDHYQKFIQMSSKTHSDLVAQVKRHLNYLQKIQKDQKK